MKLTWKGNKLKLILDIIILFICVLLHVCQKETILFVEFLKLIFLKVASHAQIDIVQIDVGLLFSLNLLIRHTKNNGMTTFSIHHQWWWWRWKSCHRGLVSPPGWLSSGDLRWQFACRLQPPSAPTRGPLKAGLFSRLSKKAGANLVTTLQSQLCNLPSCHLGTSQTPTPKAVFLSVSFSPKSHTGPLQRRWVPFVFSLSELYFWRQWTHSQPCLQVALNAMVRLAILEEPTYAACLIFSLKSHHPNLGKHNSCLWFQN